MRNLFQYMIKNILPHSNIGFITQVLHRLPSVKHIAQTECDRSQRITYVLPKANYVVFSLSTYIIFYEVLCTYVVIESIIMSLMSTKNNKIILYESF